MTKSQIRNQMKDLRASLSVEERNIFNHAIRQRLFDLQAYRSCSKIFTYVSFQTEIDTRIILSNAWENNKRVFVPRVEGKKMDFYEIHTAKFLVPSKFGVPEPEKDEKKRYIGVEECSEINSVETENSTVQSLNTADKETLLMLLPGLAFDLSGNRIGYGAGYYDRYLSEHQKDHFLKVALAYDFQVYDHLEAEEFDIRADLILTPTRLISCREMQDK